jgi:hypothetical protein
MVSGALIGTPGVSGRPVSPRIPDPKTGVLVPYRLLWVIPHEIRHPKGMLGYFFERYNAVFLRKNRSMGAV